MEEIHSAAYTIRHWRGYIQNSWKHGKSNGLSEGLNNKIKVLKRVAFDLHSFEGFRKRIFCLSLANWKTGSSSTLRTSPMRILTRHPSSRTWSACTANPMQAADWM